MLKVIQYQNIDEYLAIENHSENEIAIVNRVKWIDIDCSIAAKTEYTAFKKLVTALKNAGYENLIEGLQQDIKYKEDFINSLKIESYHYPEEQRNGFYGYYAENNEGIFYIRHFTPLN
jgi:hypothetical protein